MELLRPTTDAAFPARTATYTGTAGSTATWPMGPQGILVWSDQACYISVGTGVTATTSDTPIPPFTPIAFHAPQSLNTGPWRVSAIQVTTGGTIYCKPINIR